MWSFPGGYIPGEILHEARDPALLEQSAGNIFTARVFPIEPYAPLDEYELQRKISKNKGQNMLKHLVFHIFLLEVSGCHLPAGLRQWFDSSCLMPSHCH